MPIAADARRRIIWDSFSLLATTTGRNTLFTTTASKALLEQNPKISNVLPDGQRMRVDGMAVAFPSAYAQVDVLALDGIVFTLTVRDNEVEAEKLSGLARQFPAGGGVWGAAAIGDDGVTVEDFNNGLPAADSIFQIDPAVVIDPKINFEVSFEIPTALTGLTTGRMFVYLHGIYEFFLPNR